METKLKLIIVDDHDMFREGVKVLLGKSQKIEIMAEASNGKEFLLLLDTLSPDVVLMDISMPILDGIEATRQAVQLKPDIKILALSMFGEEEYYYKMILSGVRGFIMKSAGINELEFAIHQVANNSAYFSDELLGYVKRHIHEIPSNDKAISLTTRESIILKTIAMNFSDNEMAREINVPIETIKNVRMELYQKTGCNNTAGLVMYAIKNKIIEL